MQKIIQNEPFESSYLWETTLISPSPLGGEFRYKKKVTKLKKCSLLPKINTNTSDSSLSMM